MRIRPWQKQTVNNKSWKTAWTARVRQGMEKRVLNFIEPNAKPSLKDETALEAMLRRISEASS